MTSSEALRLFDVRDTPLSVDEVLQAVADPRAGGVAVFIGMVRNHDSHAAHEAHEAHHASVAADAPAHSPGSPSALPHAPGVPGPALGLHGSALGLHASTLGSPGSPAPTLPPSEVFPTPADRSQVLVTGLEYVAHPTALAILRETAEKVLAEHPVTALAAVHRTGELAVGDLAVVCAAASAHRAEAFAACRDLIDTLKARVPIWKREQFEDGSHIWVGC